MGVDEGFVVAIMAVEVEQVVLVVESDVGIASQCVMRACLRNTLWLAKFAEHPRHW